MQTFEDGLKNCSMGGSIQYKMFWVDAPQLQTVQPLLQLGKEFCGLVIMMIFWISHVKICRRTNSWCPRYIYNRTP
ncbi:hypothetical protein COP2_016568 [Malus domestica]